MRNENNIAGKTLLLWIWVIAPLLFLFAAPESADLEVRLSVGLGVCPILAYIAAVMWIDRQAKNAELDRLRSRSH